MKFALTMTGGIIVLFLLFYFYPTPLYEAIVIGESGEIAVDVAMKAFWNTHFLPSEINATNVTRVVPTIRGWLVIFIIHLGTPLMIAWRVATVKKEKTN